MNKLDVKHMLLHECQCISVPRVKARCGARSACSEKLGKRRLVVREM